MADLETLLADTRYFVDQGSDPAAPSAGNRALYTKAGGLYLRSSAAILGPVLDETAHDALNHTGVPGVGGAGVILQIVTAQSTTVDNTTSTSLVDSSLSAVITPLEADSILRIEVTGECSVGRVAGSPQERFQWVAISNSTDAVLVQEEARGHFVAASSAALDAFNAIGLLGYYTVNSLTARTFRLRHRSPVVTNVQSTIHGDRTGGVRMTIMEIAA